MKIRNSNAYAALIVIVLVAIISISFFIILKPYGILYEKFMSNDDYTAHATEALCTADGGFWNDGVCESLPTLARDTINFNRKIWLLTPIIFILGLFIWLWTVSTRRDPQEFYLR